jgi:hypothetical protein
LAAGNQPAGLEHPHQLTTKDLIQRDEWMIKLDLKDTYL